MRIYLDKHSVCTLDRIGKTLSLNTHWNFYNQYKLASENTVASVSVAKNNDKTWLGSQIMSFSRTLTYLSWFFLMHSSLYYMRTHEGIFDTERLWKNSFHTFKSCIASSWHLKWNLNTNIKHVYMKVLITA